MTAVLNPLNDRNPYSGNIGTGSLAQARSSAGRFERTTAVVAVERRDERLRVRITIGRVRQEASRNRRRERLTRAVDGSAAHAELCVRHGASQREVGDDAE